VLCQRCGKLNSLDREICKYCHSKLFVLAQVKPAESLDLQPFIGMEDYLVDKLTMVERQAHRSSEDVELLAEAVDFLERNLMVYRAGISVLARMLREHGILEPTEFRSRWRDRTLKDLKELNRKERFLEVRPDIMEAFSGRSRQRFEDRISRAEDCLFSLDSRAAVPILEDALSLDPANAPLNAFVGQIYLSRGELVLARRHMERALSSPAPPLSAFLAMALLELRSGNPDKALHLLQKAGGKDPSDPDTTTLMAFIQGVRHRWASCQTLAERALAAQDGPAPRFLAAQALLHQGKTKLGEAALDDLLTLFPECELALLQRARLFLYRRWWKRAREVFERLRSLNSVHDLEALERGFRSASEQEREALRLIPLTLEGIVEMMGQESEDTGMYLRQVEADI
jgi:tetratricopeptide (TPR) repeat protein